MAKENSSPHSHMTSGQGPLPWLTSQLMGVIAVPLSLIFILITTTLLYSTCELPAPKIPPRKVLVTAELAKKKVAGGQYGAILARDAKDWGIDRDDVALEIMKKAHPHFIEFTGDIGLEADKSFETTHLKLSLKIEKITVGEEGSEMSTDHMVMTIQNKTDKFIAYQVKTAIVGKCSAKAVIAHNALALKPKEELNRTECLPNGPGELRISMVEVMELNQLGYYYISRLDPERLFMDPRTTEGHQVPLQKICKILPWRAIHHAVKKGGAGWRDVIDYYARHNCDRYFFFPSYRYSDKGVKVLPAKAPE